MGSPSRAALDAALQHPSFEDVTSLPNVRADLRYGTTNNLLRRDVYGGFQRVLLHREAAAKFRQASALLSEQLPGHGFIVFDALRPQAAQVEFWNLVKGTAQQPYFADPVKGSVHSYGFAIDLSLVSPDGQELDMGTDFDDLTPLAEPKREEEFLAAGQLTATQRENRLLLRRIMESAGFLQLPHEWWHFDALAPTEVRARYQRLE